MRKSKRALSIGAELLRPPPPRTADQWADQCRILPQGSAEPGPWRSARTPYMIQIMRACSDPHYKRIIAVMGSQMGKSEGLFNVIGHRLDDDPAPVLFIAPNQKLAESVSNDRVMKMFKSVPSLWSKLAKGKQNKMTEKFIAGVRLGFGWAGSATELSSHPAGIVLVDERDRMGNDVDGEGDPVELAEARTSTFPDGKVIVTSTPTIEGGSPIWALYEEGTRFQWAWPCPECGEYFSPRFELLTWPKDATPQQTLKEARIQCPVCDALIGDEHKTAMNARGVYVAPGQEITPQGEIIGDPPDSDTASFWVSGLCSPWRTFGQRAKSFLEATRSKEPGRIQAVINTGFGELYKMSGEAPDWERVAELRGGYSSDEIPKGVQRITCGVDVQKNRLVYAVRGWGVNFESWLIRAGELWGETEYSEVWNQLSALLQTNWGKLQISLMLIDSGYRPGSARQPINQIYEFCRRNPRRAAPAKGHDTQDKPVKSAKIEIDSRGGIAKRGLQLWHIDSDYFKSWVHGRIEWPAGEPGAWHLSDDVTDDYCQQIVAEQRLVKASGKVTWIKTRKDNHFLDCEALNAAAATIRQVHTLRKVIEGSTRKSKPQRRVIRSTWMDSGVAF
ncbi:MAG: phage terminase large subunit family protein [Magnetococcales bacterium]|nr:phage terminase large subunit family protein [Magnetococcales bacterium]